MKTVRTIAILILVGGGVVVSARSACGQPFAQAPSAPTAPGGDDFSAASLHRYIADLRASYGDDYRLVPLDVKAEFFEWVMWRYHLTDYDQILEAVELAEAAGVRPQPVVGSDTCTWNGALLAALSYKYAVTKDAETLRRIVTLLSGLRLYSQVTGRPGCYARCVVPAGTHVREHEINKFGLFENTMPDGRKYYLLGSPAKGTYNQLAGGYAAMMMLAADDLPPDVQLQARRDVTALVKHVLSDDYHIVGPDGRRTPYGDLTPVVASVGVPFNGQVAYEIVALGHFFPGDDPQAQKQIARQFQRLREDRPSYYKDPYKSPIVPQRIGNHPLVKGMNDRFHVTNAAFIGLAMDIDYRRRIGKPLNPTFMYRLGRTMYWSMRNISNQRNALCNFMWAGMLSDPERFEMIVRQRERVATERQIERCLADGVEQLRRFRLDRFVHEGRYEKTDKLQWLDAQTPDVYHWKADPKARWNVTGPATNKHIAAIDYLFAYWLFRYYNLDSQLP